MAATPNEYIKSCKRLREALNQEKNEYIRDSVIQRFEFCIELAWKTGKKLMGTSSSSPKNVLREMAQDGYIEDVIVWLEAIDHRNLSTHTYNEDLAEKVYSFIQNFYPELEKLAKKFSKK